MNQNQALYQRRYSTLIVPNPIKGNLNEVNNYRGITLTSIFSKILSMLIDTRLRKLSNDNNALHKNQFGFVKGKSTVDCNFVLIVNTEHRICHVSFISYQKKSKN